jgi:hypothetical protein
MIARRLCLTVVVVRGSRDAPHARAIRLPIVAIVIVGHGHSPLRTLIVPPLATRDALPGASNGDIRQHLPAAAWGHLPASWWKMKFSFFAAPWWCT